MVPMSHSAGPALANRRRLRGPTRKQEIRLRDRTGSRWIGRACHSYRGRLSRSSADVTHCDKRERIKDARQSLEGSAFPGRAWERDSIKALEVLLQLLLVIARRRPLGFGADRFAQVGRKLRKPRFLAQRAGGPVGVARGDGVLRGLTRQIGIGARLGGLLF